MKCIVLAVFCLAFCAFGLAELQNNVVAGPLELQLKAGSDLVTEDDKLLLQNLASLDLSQRNAIADLITNILESVRGVVINGNDVLPPLDPLLVPSVGPVEFSTTGIRVSATLNNFNAEGLRWYVVDDVSFNTLRLAIGVRLTLPWMTVTGSYDANALITLIRHTAGGNFRVFINRFETSVDLRLGTSVLGGGRLFLRELEIGLKIHDVQVNISGMVGSNILNGMINSLVQDIAHNLLVEELHTVAELLSRELFDTINELLSNFTLDDLLGN